MATEEWITTQDAADLSGYHPEYVRRLIRQGKIKAELKGTMFWVSKSSLLSFVHEAKKSSQHDKRHGPKRQ